MVVTTGAYRRSDRLRESRDFRRVSRDGRRASNTAFVMLVTRPGPGAAAGSRRLGISASRKVGNAVVRNRIKRCVREWFRAFRLRLPIDTDIVVIARSAAARLDGGGIAESLNALAHHQAKRSDDSRRSR